MKRFTITGASGWLGQETIYYLLKDDKYRLSDFQLFSSQDRFLNFGDYGSIQSKNLFSASAQDVETTECFIHLAFLTRDKVNVLGAQKLFEINSQITDFVAKLIRHANPKRVINVSSGAVFNRYTLKLDDDSNKNPYGVAKLREENELQHVAEEIDANIAIGRLWGAMGSHMPINRAYAVSDMIMSAIETAKIEIKSSHEVWRRFCDAAEFMSVLLRLSEVETKSIINSGGVKIEIGALGKLVASHFRDCEVMRPTLTYDFVDDYYPLDDDFEDLAGRFNLPLSDIYSLVAKTVQNHKNLLGLVD